MSVDPTHRGYALFCDDIRIEQGDKTTIVGAYDSEMLVHGDFPFLLPKFGIAIRYQEMRGKFKEEPVVWQIYLPGDDEKMPSLQFPVPDAPEMRIAVKRHPTDEDSNETHYLQIATNLIFSPLVFNQPGKLRVRALCGSIMVKLGSLRITRANAV